MNENAWIAYVSPFPFPWGQAGSRRICGIARTLAAGGHKVVVGCGDVLPQEYTRLDEGEPLGAVKYIGLGESPGKGASVIQKSFRIFLAWGSRTIAWLDSRADKPTHVIVYGGSAQYMLRLLPWCRQHKVKLVADVVEWYSPAQMTGGALGPFNLSAKFALKYLYPKCDGVIAISTLLTQHYSAAGRPVVRIPPTLDVLGSPLPARVPDRTATRLTLVYAGTPGKKDLLANVIAGVRRVDPEGERVRLLVIGPTSEQVKDMLRGQDGPACMEVLGHLPQAAVHHYLRMADFSVLLREPARFSNAGFPTKFVESMSNGTPVIANLTSDIGLYLRDGAEGLVCADHSVDAFVVALERALNLSAQEKLQMRIASRQRAEIAFDFRHYTSELNHFLRTL